MTGGWFDQVVAVTTAGLLLTSVLMVARHALTASIRLLAVQGVALALLVAATGVDERSPELFAVAVLVLALKGAVLPVVLTRAVASTGSTAEAAPRVGRPTGLLAVTLLVTLAYLVSRPLGVLGDSAAARSVPIGVAMVLIGFLLLVTRRRALSQILGFLLLDNGIATVALLTAGGVPLIVELGASLDVLLVVLVLQVLLVRVSAAFGGGDLDDMSELRD